MERDQNDMRNGGYGSHERSGSNNDENRWMGGSDSERNRQEPDTSEHGWIPGADRDTPRYTSDYGPDDELRMSDMNEGRGDMGTGGYGNGRSDTLRFSEEVDDEGFWFESDDNRQSMRDDNESSGVRSTGMGGYGTDSDDLRLTGDDDDDNDDDDSGERRLSDWGEVDPQSNPSRPPSDMDPSGPGSAV